MTDQITTTRGTRDGDRPATATRRRLLAAVGSATAAATAGCAGGGDGDGPGGDAGTTIVDEFGFRTSAFDGGGTIPVGYTCDGANESPPLLVGAAGLPSEPETLALVVDDPDAPGGTFTHWLLWNVPVDVGSIPAGAPNAEVLGGLGEARQGENDAGGIGYTGPCPPADDGSHTYRFTAYAVASALGLDPGARKAALTEALSGPTVATSRFTAEYERE